MSRAAKPKKKIPKKPSLDPEKIAEALDYRTQGYAAPQIADAMKLSVSRVEQLIEEGLERTYIEPPHFAIKLEIRRLNMAQQSIIGQVAAGDAEAIRLMMTIEEKLARAKMLLVPDMKDLFANAALLTIGSIDKKGNTKTGRPPHQKTVASCAKVDAMAFVGTKIDVIAKIMGMSEMTLRKHYADVIETARDRAIAMAGGVVMQSAIKGNSTDARYILERLGPNEWKAPAPTPGGGGKTDPAGANVKYVTEIEGGLPTGSTPENPEGTQPIEGEAPVPPAADQEGETVSPTGHETN